MTDHRDCRSFTPPRTVQESCVSPMSFPSNHHQGTPSQAFDFSFNGQFEMENVMDVQVSLPALDEDDDEESILSEELRSPIAVPSYAMPRFTTMAPLSPSEELRPSRSRPADPTRTASQAADGYRPARTASSPRTIPDYVPRATAMPAFAPRTLDDARSSPQPFDPDLNKSPSFYPTHAYYPTQAPSSSPIVSQQRPNHPLSRSNSQVMTNPKQDARQTLQYLRGQAAPPSALAQGLPRPDFGDERSWQETVAQKGRFHPYRTTSHGSLDPHHPLPPTGRATARGSGGR